MKPLLIFLLLLFIVSCEAQQEQPVDSRKTEIVFQHVNVIPMDKERVIENQDVLVKDGIIKEVNDAGKIKFSGDALVINAEGKYLMPGLAEMHAHIPTVDDLEPMKKVLLLFAVNGVTTIRGMLGNPKHLELRSKIQSGEILGPHFYTAGPPFSGQSVKTPEIAVDMVKEEKEAGYDFLKILPGLSLVTFNAVIRTAKEVNIPFAGHVPFEVGVWRAIDAGYASIDHMDGFVESLVPGIETMKEDDTGLFGMFVANKADTSKIPQLLHALKEKHIWVVPTQCLAERWFTPSETPEELSREPEMVYMEQDLLNNWVTAKKNLIANPKYDPKAIKNFIGLRRKLIYQCNKNGVGLLLGSDAPQVFDVPGFSLHHELKYLVDASLTPYEALRTGTVNPAIYFNKINTGTIKIGNAADLVLLNGNPLMDITQVENIEGVMLNNNWLSKKFIEQTLQQLEKK